MNYIYTKQTRSLDKLKGNQMTSQMAKRYQTHNVTLKALKYLSI